MDKRGIAGILVIMKTWFLGFFTAAAGILMLPSVAYAGTQTVIYEVYAGGIHAVQADLTLKTGKGRYDIVLNARTRGMLAKLAPWHGTFESHGWTEKDGAFRPEIHKSTAVWRGEEEIKTYRYARDGRFLGLIETLDGEVSKDTKESLSAELTKDTTDALTATLNVLQKVAKGGECSGSADVFDGRRRFTQITKDKGIAELEPSKYNIFKGKAAECTVEIIPVAGEWHKKPRGWMSIQEQGRAQGTMPTMWAAMLENGNPAVPVKVRVKTAYGVFFMHVAQFKGDTSAAVAEDAGKE